MANRKGWAHLSPAYQRRLERGGITPESYQAGAGLAKHRGHKSEQAEASTAKTRRERRKLIELADQVLFLGLGQQQIAVSTHRFNMDGRDSWQAGWPRAYVDILDMYEQEGYDVTRDRLKEQAYDTNEYVQRRNREPGRDHWNARIRTIPDSMWYYHGT
jgi:hypothetical protein